MLSALPNSTPELFGLWLLLLLLVNETYVPHPFKNMPNPIYGDKFCTQSKNISALGRPRRLESGKEKSL